MSIKIKAPDEIQLKPTIMVFGVGGAGGNAVNNMISAQLKGVNFCVANTDAQALQHSLAEQKIQLGGSLTKGLGAGAVPEVGAAAAEEALAEIKEQLKGSNMVFITAGMGGGTGTGAAPIIAKIAKEQDILTVGVVTKPFNFEGKHRMNLAEQGLIELQKYVDTLIVIPNQNLFRIANEKTTFADAFKMADDVLHAGVRGVTDLMIMPGLINLDFADIRSVMREMGKAMMGTGEAEAENRAIQAAEAAISNPLLDISSMKGAKGVLINITGGTDMTLFEVDEAANRIRDEVDPDANIIFGSTFSEALSGKIRVSVVATGIETNETMGYRIPTPQSRPEENKSSFNFDDFVNQAREDRAKFIPSRPASVEDYKSANERHSAEPETNNFIEESAELLDEEGYDDEASESNNSGIRTYKKSPQIEHFDEKPQQPKKKESNGGAFGLFKRMADSIKGTNSREEYRSDSNNDSEEFNKEAYKTPAFIRKSRNTVDS